MSEAHADHHPSYVKIYGILLVLLVISIFGPFLEIPVVTLVTAFGIAVVKAYLVARNFMHLNIQPAYVNYLLATCLVFMLLLFAGTAPDVMKKDGDQWVKAAVTLPRPGHGDSGDHDEHGEEGGDAHGAASEGGP